MSEAARQADADVMEYARLRALAIADAAQEAIASRADAIAADPTLSTITLVIKLRGQLGDPQVIYRTESAPARH